MIIDKTKLIELYGDLDTAKPLIQLFIDKSANLISEIEKAVILETQPQLDAICHRLIGQARYIGSPVIEQLAIDLRDQKNIEKLSTLSQLKSTIEQLKDVQL